MCPRMPTSSSITPGSAQRRAGRADGAFLQVLGQQAQLGQRALHIDVPHRAEIRTCQGIVRLVRGEVSGSASSDRATRSLQQWMGGGVKPAITRSFVQWVRTEFDVDSGCCRRRSSCGAAG